MLIGHDWWLRAAVIGAVSRKRDVHLMSFLRCNAYITLIQKNPQEAFSTEQQ
jgi:hypothetical protein